MRWFSWDFWNLKNLTSGHNVANGDLLRQNISCEDSVTAGSGCWNYGIQSAGDARIFAVYRADSWHLSPTLRIDLGARPAWFSLQNALDHGAIPTGIINPQNLSPTATGQYLLQ